MKCRTSFFWMSLAIAITCVAVAIHQVDVRCIQCGESCFQEPVIARMFSCEESQPIHTRCIPAYLEDQSRASADEEVVFMLENQ